MLHCMGGSWNAKVGRPPPVFDHDVLDGSLEDGLEGDEVCPPPLNPNPINSPLQGMIMHGIFKEKKRSLTIKFDQFAMALEGLIP